MKKLIQGKVISDKMNKTIVVVSEKIKKHPLYGKFLKRKTKYYVHDEHNLAKEGDIVLIQFVRPISKLKRWKLVKILKSKVNKEEKNDTA